MVVGISKNVLPVLLLLKKSLELRGFKNAYLGQSFSVNCDLKFMRNS